MFTPEIIRARIRAQPFVPVRIVTSSGETFDMRHPDLVWVGERELHVGFPSRRDPSIYSMTTRIALIHITELRDLESDANTTQPPTNGAGPNQA